MSRYSLGGDSAITAETQWRCSGAHPLLQSGDSRTRIVASRWSLDTPAPDAELSRDGNAYHTLAVNLKSTDLTFHHENRVLCDGRAMPGVTQVTQPGQRVSAIFMAPCDVLHLYVSQELLAECHAHASGRPAAGDVVLGDPSLTQDAAISRLAHALMCVQAEGLSFGSLFIDSIGLAIVTRLLAREMPVVRKAAEHAVNPLPRWRLQRAIDYIDAHLFEPIRLEDIAGSTGLTRMHFAAQFRAATGMRPHEYLLQRRIEEARALLAGSERSVIEVALATGFRSQAHFTTVFRQRVGETPARFRAQMRQAGHARHAAPELVTWGR